ncbi:MAG TPA: RDD family protein [Acidimicrobiia bacterium]|nr:RDD family protein [Acidimicrobiia bacterium]
MDDYYSLLGVEPGASVDDIRGAYRERKNGIDTSSESGRSDAARLNKAWNVLSDPYQRGRYDEQRANGSENGSEVEDLTPASNGSRSPAALPPRKQRQQAARDARAKRTQREPTIPLPAGTRRPTTKQRLLAMAIDLLVLFFLVMGGQLLAGNVAKSQKPAVVKQINSLNDQISATNKVKSDADKRVSADKKANNTAAQSTDQKASDDAKAKVTTLTKQRDDALAKVNVYYIAMVAIAFFLGLLYLVIPSALTGRTLGKHFQHLKVLREDGSPLGASGALMRYGVVVLVTFVLYYLLQQIAAIIVLFGVTMWMRNPDMQGLHDRLAHTIVVSDAQT